MSVNGYDVISAKRFEIRYVQSADISCYFLLALQCPLLLVSNGKLELRSLQKVCRCFSGY